MADRPTMAQEQFLRRLLLSSAIPPDEASTMTRWLDSLAANVTRPRVSQAIDYCKGLIAQRDAARAASKKRREVYARQKQIPATIAGNTRPTCFGEHVMGHRTCILCQWELHCIPVGNPIFEEETKIGEQGDL